MAATYFYYLVVLAVTAQSRAADCDPGWMPYKDEFCVKILNYFVTHQEAKNLCSSEGNALSKASLVMIKDADMQAFLTEYTDDTYDTLWLGGKYDNDTSEFKWDDGDPVKYSNWQEGYPRNVTDEDSCIELRPANSKLATVSDGNWANVVCQKRNLPMCQKTLSWSLGDAVNEIIRIRNHLEEVNKQLREELAAVNARVVPVGSIYIEYYDQPSPTTLWPNLVWEDITNTYAGLFFRASGGGADEWGTTQADCAPRITQTHFASGQSNVRDPLNIPPSGWSEFGFSGDFRMNGDPSRNEAIQYHTAGCEVRPKNQAVRIWKRTE